MLNEITHDKRCAFSLLLVMHTSIRPILLLHDEEFLIAFVLLLNVLYILSHSNRL